MSRKTLVPLALAPVAGLAQSSPTISLPAEFSSAVNELQGVGQSAATAIAPMVLAVTGAFVVIGLIFVAVRFFTRSTRQR